jgi:glycosyl transferase family 87
LPFPYPPAFLLLVIPFGLLPFAVGMAAWSAATFPLYFLAVKRMFPDSGWLPAAFPPVFVAAVIGQNSFVMAALLVGGLVLLQKRPFVAGLVLGCLILKPQMALLLPVAMLAARKWRTIFGAALSSTGILVLGVMVFGLAATRAWIDQMPLYVDIARNWLVGWQKLASVYAAARQAGLDAGVAMTIHGVIAAAAAAAVWKIWWSDADHGCKAAALIAGTMLVSPYLFLYDAVALVVPFLWLAKQKADPALLAMAWCLPIVTVAQITVMAGPVNLNPLTPIVLLVLICHQAWFANRKAVEPEGSPALA